MTPKTFWIIVIKIIGIYAILQLVSIVPQVLNSFFWLFTTSVNNPPGGDPNYANQINYTGLLIELAYCIAQIFFYFLIVRYCIFKPSVIINKLKLVDGLEDERLEFNIHRSTILKIAVIITGALTLITSVPFLIETLFGYFQTAENYRRFIDDPEAKYIAMHFLKTVAGLFMLTCSRMIVNYIELKQRRKPIVNKE